MTFKGKLYPYQQEGFDAFLKTGRAMLAYEVGLGKTPTALASIEELMDMDTITEPGYVFTLASLKYQWAKAIEKFTDSTPLVIDGTPKKRAEQYELARNWRETGVDYVVVNYELAVGDYAQLRKLPKGFAIYDESTALKSISSKRHWKTKTLTSRVPFRIQLTGTPMDNGKPEELFNQLAVLDPDILGPWSDFEERYIVRDWFGGISGYKNIDELHKRIAPYVISKKQTDPEVAPFLPKTIYREPVIVPFDRASKVVYRRIANDLLEKLDIAVQQGINIVNPEVGGQEGELRGEIASRTGALRMLCNDPRLLQHSADRFNEGNGHGSEYLAGLAAEGALDKLTKSPKADAVKAYINDFLEPYEKNKAVIFSSQVPTTEYLQEALKWGSEVYTGKLNAKQKEAAKERFQHDPDTRLLISSDAGGYGVDLPQANLLINFDLPWGSGTAAQRNGRIRRASSTWEHVVIQHFFMEGSIEIRQWQQLEQKFRVEKAIIDGVGADEFGDVALTVDSLRTFLRENPL